MRNEKVIAVIIQCVMGLLICSLTGCSILPSAEDIKEKIAQSVDDWSAKDYENWYNKGIEFHNEGSTYQMKEVTKLLVECFSRNDAEKLKSLLCERTKGMPEIDEQIREALEFVGGDIIAYNEPKHYPNELEGKRKDNGKVTKARRNWYIKDIETESGGKFEIYIDVDFLDTRDLAREGVTKILITRDDGEKIQIGYYWKEYHDIALDTAHTLRNQIDAGDTEGIRSMFSEQSQMNGELTSQIEALITFYEGASLRGKPEEPNKRNIRYDEKRDYRIYSAEAETAGNNASVRIFKDTPIRIFIETFMNNMMTDAGKTYTIRFFMYNRNDANPDTVGISQIIITRDDGVELSVGELIRENGDETQIFIP